MGMIRADVVIAPHNLYKIFVVPQKYTFVMLPGRGMIFNFVICKDKFIFFEIIIFVDLFLIII